MRFNGSTPRLASASALAAFGLLVGVAACRSDEVLTPGAAGPADGPSFAVVGARPTYTPPQDENGVYLLDRVCDVFIGDDPLLSSYTHQTLVDIPAGSKVKLVGDVKTFVCDARDYDENGNLVLLDANGQPATAENGGQVQPVIDPVTLHAVKGDGPKINTSGIDFDLNGYSITVFPTPEDDARFENLGVVVTGANVTVRNSAVVATDESGAVTGVTRIFGFGHNLELAALNPTLKGEIYDGVYNLETRGGMNVRQSSGTAIVDKVKSVDLDPIAGQGFEIRRCAAGSRSYITNSWFVGGTEGVFIRECAGVTLDRNTVSGQAGDGIVTRQATSSTNFPIVITNNTLFENGATAIAWGRDSRSSGGLNVSANRITTSACGIGRSTRNTTIAPYLSVGAIANAQTSISATVRTCTVQ